MTLSVTVRPGSALSLAATARALLHWVSCSNPFYVISAGLFLVGLRLSFPAQASEVETWSLMGGLAGYTLLLALTACLLVRFARAWQDLRTVLLLVVLMFLATSVTFDEVLIVSLLPHGTSRYRAGERRSFARHSSEIAGMVPGAFLFDHGVVFSLSAGACQACGQTT
jgi:hypothetical protein